MNVSKYKKRQRPPYLVPNFAWFAALGGMSAAYLIWSLVLVPEIRLYSCETFWITMPILVVGFSICILVAFRSGFTLRDLGIRFDHWRRDIVLAPLAAIIIILPALLIKFYWIKGRGEPLFDFSSYLNPWVVPAYLMVIVPIQNFIFRSCLQGVLYNVKFFDRSRIMVIVFTSILYSAFHWHISPILVLLTFFPGLLWGILYDYTYSLLALVLSHAITGLTFFYIIGIPRYFLLPVGF